MKNRYLFILEETEKTMRNENITKKEKNFNERTFTHPIIWNY